MSVEDKIDAIHASVRDLKVDLEDGYRNQEALSAIEKGLEGLRTARSLSAKAREHVGDYLQRYVDDLQESLNAMEELEDFNQQVFDLTYQEFLIAESVVADFLSGSTKEAALPDNNKYFAFMSLFPRAMPLSEAFAENMLPNGVLIDEASYAVLDGLTNAGHVVKCYIGNRHRDPDTLALDDDVTKREAVSMTRERRVQLCSFRDDVHVLTKLRDRVYGYTAYSWGDEQSSSMGKFILPEEYSESDLFESFRAYVQSLPARSGALPLELSVGEKQSLFWI